MATPPEPADPADKADKADPAGIAEVVAEAGRLLLANGHTTDDTVRRIEGLARAYGLQVTAVPAWSSLTLVGAPGTALVTLPVTPLGEHAGGHGGAGDRGRCRRASVLVKLAAAD